MMPDVGAVERMLTLLIEHAVPILTALAALVGAVGAVLSVLKGSENGRKISDVKDAAVTAATKAENLHDIVNSRVDMVIDAIRRMAEEKIAALRTELAAERRKTHDMKEGDWPNNAPG